MNCSWWCCLQSYFALSTELQKHITKGKSKQVAGQALHKIKLHVKLFVALDTDTTYF